MPSGKLIDTMQKVALTRPPYLACLLLASGFAVALLTPCFAQKPAEAPPFITGQRLQLQLDLPMTATWENLPFRQALASLSKVQQLAIVLDRRVDPEEPISLAIPGDSLRVGLEKIAQRRGLGVSILGSVVYFGPKESASKLRTLAELRKQEFQQALGPPKTFLAPRRWSWR